MKSQLLSTLYQSFYFLLFSAHKSRSVGFSSIWRMSSDVILTGLNGTNHSFVMSDANLFYSSLLDTHLALPQWEALLAITSTTVIILGTIVGNVLVIISVFTHTPLKITPNFFIVSLAAADLTVSICVLPLNVAYMVVGKWIFGSVLCKIWLTSDVLCCTASILNLCAIALDRYYALHDPIKHAQRRSVRYVLAKVLVVWIMSIAICFPPLFGWNDWPDKFTSETPCRLTEEKGYVIYSSMGSFYIPLGIIMFVYLKIYQNTSQRLRSRAKASNLTTSTLQNRQQSRDNLLVETDGRYGGTKATLKVTLQEQMEIVNGQPVQSEVVLEATMVPLTTKATPSSKPTPTITTNTTTARTTLSRGKEMLKPNIPAQKHTSTEVCMVVCIGTYIYYYMYWSI